MQSIPRECGFCPLVQAVFQKILEKPTFLVLERGPSLEGESHRQDVQQKYNNSSMATFESFDIAAQVVANLSQYQNYLSRIEK